MAHLLLSEKDSMVIVLDELFHQSNFCFLSLANEEKCVSALNHNICITRQSV